MRPRSKSACAVLIAVGLAVVTVTASCVPELDYLAGGRFGIAAGGAFATQRPTALRKELDGDVALGATWIRFDFEWPHLEPQEGVFRWGPHDTAVAAARSRGLSILGILDYTPAWARAAGTDKFHPPLSPSDFAAYAGAVVAHYAPRGVHAWEIWNEPNSRSFWKRCPNPAGYAALIEAAYPAIKGVDPSATVVFGGMAPAATNGCDYNARAFLRAAYAHGVHGSFDALGYHPYSYPNAPGGWTNNNWTQMYLTSPNLLGIMAAHGDGRKKIWGTEWGDPVTRVSESVQATHTREAYALWTHYSWAGPLFTFSYTNRQGFSLVRRDGARRPAWYAYRRASRGD